MELTPYHIDEYVIEDNGLVTILSPKFTNKFIVKYLVPMLKSKHFKIKLDEFGSKTWLQIDGQKNVHTIGENLTNEFGDKIQPVFERLTNFLSQLYHHQYIDFKDLKKGE